MIDYNYILENSNFDPQYYTDFLQMLSEYEQLEKLDS